ncbi:hypothetical protein [Actinoplanes awajinensis]|nr:hypothetical protein [Actinoplanes awajinensis]
MDLRELCFHLRHRRRMYVFDDRFLTVVGFVEGYNSALDGRPLRGFHDHVAERVLGRYSPRHWSMIIASAEPLVAARGDRDLHDLPQELQLSLTHRLVDLLEEYADQSRDA